MDSALIHALENYSQVGNQLTISGVSIRSIVEETGTPVYLYSTDQINKKHNQIRRDLPNRLAIYYAIKANPNRHILSLMNNLYDGFDIASAGELSIARDTGIDPERLHFAGPGKSFEELKFAIDGHIGGISIESETELDHIIRICDRKKETNIWIRINPEFEHSNAGMKMGGGPKQFGIDYSRIPDVIKKVRTLKNLNFLGIHVFAGSQILILTLFCPYSQTLLQWPVLSER